MLERLRTFVAQRAPTSLGGRALLLLVDAVLFNVVFYEMMRALLLRPLGYASMATTVLWVIAFASVAVGLQTLHPYRGTRTLLGFGSQLLVISAFAVTVTKLAAMKTVDKGGDFSWLRIEIVKVPLWLTMFFKTCPGTASLMLAVILLCAWRMLAAPRSLWIRAVPLLILVTFWFYVHSVFGSFPNHEGKPGLYTVMFCGPLAAFAVLFASGALASALRTVPLVMHMGLIGLSYVGLSPMHAAAPQFETVATAPGATPLTNAYGVTRLFPHDAKDLTPAMVFLRKMVLTPDNIYVSFGPTCGIYKIQRRSGEVLEANFRGLVRDMGFSPDGRSLWGVNQMTGDLMAIDPDSLRVQCVADMFRLGLAVPWGFTVDKDTAKVFLSNVTLPIVAELSVQMQGPTCSVHIDRSIDFHRNGYTKFTDGAFGHYLDRAHDRLYVLVGMLEGRFEMGLVEVELSTFRVLRDLRLPAGAAIIAVHGQHTALLPSYYDDFVYEVDLTTMRILRRVRAAPTIIDIEQDDKRGLYYATSRTAGELLVIDAKRFEVVRRYAVGAKPEALGLDTAADQLFVGGSKGIFRIDLKRFLASP